MLRSISVSFLAVSALGALFHLLSVTCYGQEAKDWYSLAGAALEGYKRQGVDYGASEHEALEKAGKDCGEYADQISEALHWAFVKERYNCRGDDACDKLAYDKYEKRKKELLEELNSLCNERELEVRFHYLEQRMERAKRQYKEEVDRINKELAQLIIDEMMENAWHAIRNEAIASEENATKKALLRDNEDRRHRQRRAEIDTSRDRLRGDLQRSRDQLEEEFKKD